MEARADKEVIALTAEVARCTQWSVARPQVASALLGLLCTQATDDFNVTVKEERSWLADITVIEEPRSCTTTEVGVDERVW